MNPEFSTGLMVSIVGLAITFLALFLFIGVIYLLKALFPYKPETEGDKEGDEEADMIEAPASDGDEELIAAITAVAYLKGRSSSSSIPSRNPIWTSK